MLLERRNIGQSGQREVNYNVIPHCSPQPLCDYIVYAPLCVMIRFMIVYKCIHGAAPSYLTNLCFPVATNTSRRYLRSATYGNLLVPRTRTVTYGPRSFAVSGPTVWNTLPSTLRASTTTLRQFQSGLKTILFRLVYRA